MKKKIILFGDVNSFISTLLIRVFLQNLDSRFELIAIVNTTSREIRNTKSFFIFLVKKIFNPFDKNLRMMKNDSYLDFINKKIIIDSENINDEKFVKQILELIKI